MSAQVHSGLVPRCVSRLRSNRFGSGPRQYPPTASAKKDRRIACGKVESTDVNWMIWFFSFQLDVCLFRLTLREFAYCVARGPICRLPPLCAAYITIRSRCCKPSARPRFPNDRSELLSRNLWRIPVRRRGSPFALRASATTDLPPHTHAGSHSCACFQPLVSRIRIISLNNTNLNKLA